MVVSKCEAGLSPGTGHGDRLHGEGSMPGITGSCGRTPVPFSLSIGQPKTYSGRRVSPIVIASHLASIFTSSLCWTGFPMKSLIPA